MDVRSNKRSLGRYEPAGGKVRMFALGLIDDRETEAA